MPSPPCVPRPSGSAAPPPRRLWVLAGRGLHRCLGWGPCAQRCAPPPRPRGVRGCCGDPTGMRLGTDRPLPSASHEPAPAVPLLGWLGSGALAAAHGTEELGGGLAGAGRWAGVTAGAVPGGGGGSLGGLTSACPRVQAEEDVEEPQRHYPKHPGGDGLPGAHHLQEHPPPGARLDQAHHHRQTCPRRPGEPCAAAAAARGHLVASARPCPTLCSAPRSTKPPTSWWASLGRSRWSSRRRTVAG